MFIVSSAHYLVMVLSIIEVIYAVGMLLHLLMQVHNIV